MPDVVKVSTVETMPNLMAALEEYFKTGRYAEITQAIGMHSIMIRSEHTIGDQRVLYGFVLSMLKNKLSGALGAKYAAWYAEFPKLLDEVIAKSRVLVNQACTDALCSHRAAYGPFKSLDDFFFWCLDDRRLTLSQIIAYIDKTAEPVGH